MASATLLLFLIYITAALSKPAANGTQRTDDIASLPKPGICGLSLADRIEGGSRTAINAYPWASLLMVEHKHGGHAVPFCGASLISDLFVLSAAHCFPEDSENFIISKVRLGEWDILSDQDCEDDHCSDKVIDALVESIELHKEYSGKPDFHNDIALVKLETAVLFTKYIAPVCLPMVEKLRTKSETGRKFTAVGWGDIKHDAESRDVHIGNRYKFEVQFPGVDPATCRKSYPNLWDSEMCAGKTGKDTCQGDSGGPLSIAEDDGHWYQYGVVSHGYGCGWRDYPGVYTRVTSYIPWIEENMKKMIRTSSNTTRTTERPTFASQYKYLIHILNNIHVN